MPRFEEKSFVDAVQGFKITNTLVVPPILMALSRAPKPKLRSLRNIFVGGSHASDGMQQQLYSQLTPEAKVIQVYGMTEVGWATCWSKVGRDGSGSIGQPLPGTQLRFVVSL